MSKRIIVVTGASSGMGKEFVYQIIKKEPVDEIWLIARRKERLDQLARVISIKSKVLSLDLSSKEDLNTYKVILEKENVEIIILANCAGYGKIDHYENINHETTMNMMDLNMKAIVTMIDYSLPYMVKGSKIMNLSSCSGYLPIPYLNVYAASKAFVLNYSRALNRELKYRGIHVLAVCPYWVQTEFFKRAQDQQSHDVFRFYGKIYQAQPVINKAIKDLYRKRDVSLYGVINKFQIFLVKILPMNLVMNVWLKIQNLHGEKNIK